jgi:hypothetical protein
MARTSRRSGTSRNLSAAKGEPPPQGQGHLQDLRALPKRHDRGAVSRQRRALDIRADVARKHIRWANTNSTSAKAPGKPGAFAFGIDTIVSKYDNFHWFHWQGTGPCL